MKKKRKIPKSDLPQGESKKTRRLPVSREAIVTRIGNEIRQQYIDRRRAYESITQGKPSTYEPGEYWDGGVANNGYKRSRIWDKAAVFCLKYSIDHFDYVHHVFLNPPSRRSPQPNQLMSVKCLNGFRESQYGKATADRLAYIQLAFDEEVAKLYEKLADWQDIVDHDTSRVYAERDVQRAILGDNMLGLTPLFRFCLAVQKQQDDIASRYYGAAILQYLRFAKEYRAVWGKLIPTWFHKAASGCRKVLAKG